MSMNIYPFQEPAAFALCGEAAKLIWKQVADEDDEFNTDELSDLWCDLFDARWSNSFCGEIESLFPELTKKEKSTLLFSVKKDWTKPFHQATE